MEVFIKSFMLCDAIGKDMSERPVLSGIFNKIKAVTYPSNISFCIVTEWVVPEGDYKEEIKILTAQKDQLYFEILKRNFHCDQQFAVKRFLSPLKNFPLYRPGLVWFQAYLNDRLFTEFPLLLETKISRIIGGKK